ncbi:MAG TPA: hypothetical protein VL359_05790 [bacterium]|nr:hypothetical protein [bacterium]
MARSGSVQHLQLQRAAFMVALIRARQQSSKPAGHGDEDMGCSVPANVALSRL